MLNMSEFEVFVSVIASFKGIIYFLKERDQGVVLVSCNFECLGEFRLAFVIFREKVNLVDHFKYKF